MFSRPCRLLVFTTIRYRRTSTSSKSLMNNNNDNNNNNNSTVPRVTIKRVPVALTESITEILQEKFAMFNSFAQLNEDALRGTSEEEEVFYSRSLKKGDEWKISKWKFTNVQLFFTEDFSLEDLKENIVPRLERELGVPLNAQYDLVDANSWEQVVLDSYREIKIDENFIIRTTKNKALNDDEEERNVKHRQPRTMTEIILAPGLAFGSGEHPTTILCLQFLKRVIRPNVDTVVDFGCGSGILAIGALKLGASKAYGVDIDSVAVKSAIDNAKINDVDKQFTAVLGDGTEKNAQEPSNVDVLVANILVTPNIELSTKFVKMTRKGAKLGLSGILAGEQCESVIEKYKSEGCSEFRVEERDGWVCIECTTSLI
jgi:ribosomal protein L11 methyltransferase